MKPYWTTADGRQVPYGKLTDAHLKNIIADGYRNLMLRREAEKRGFDYPDRPVDKLSAVELMAWVEASASCGIEGNMMGDRLTKLFNTNIEAFKIAVNRIMEKEARDE